MSMDHLTALRDWIVGLLWPVRCAACGRIGPAACRTCLTSLKPPSTQRCPGCGHHSRDGAPCAGCRGRCMLDRLVSATPLDALSEKLVHTFKYRGIRVLAAPLAERTCDLVLRVPKGAALMSHNPIIVPVPLHSHRLRERDFNQAELLARHIAAITALPFRADLLARTRHTPQQAKAASRAVRRENMQGAFCARDVHGLKILLIDDVSTTGATLEDCARALKEAGATSVAALTFAHG